MRLEKHRTEVVDLMMDILTAASDFFPINQASSCGRDDHRLSGTNKLAVGLNIAYRIMQTALNVRGIEAGESHVRQHSVGL